MASKKIHEPGPKGGVTIYLEYLERTDPIENLAIVIGEHKIIDELKYMGIKSVGQFIDEFDEIVKRIVDRFPNFFEDESVEDIKESIIGSINPENV